MAPRNQHTNASDPKTISPPANPASRSPMTTIEKPSP